MAELTPEQEEFNWQREGYGKRLEARIARTFDAHKSSGQEFDKQVVYISGGALALTIGFLKDILTFVPKEYLVLLFLAWIGFGLSLLFNLYSHVKSTEASAHRMVLDDHYSKCYVSNNKIQIQEVLEKECKAKWEAADTAVNKLNTACMIAIGSGVIFFIGFALVIFINVEPSKEPTYTIKATVDSTDTTQVLIKVPLN